LALHELANFPVFDRMMRERGYPLFELTTEHASAAANGEPVIVHPQTWEEFIMIRKERYDAMQKWICSLTRNWDNPAVVAEVRF
jgi:hypothetical protein